MKTEASGGEREKQEEINTRATKTPLTRRATALRPRWASAESERIQSGRSRCAQALGPSGNEALKEALQFSAVCSRKERVIGQEG